jgi:hypothetical protein
MDGGVLNSENYSHSNVGLTDETQYLHTLFCHLMLKAGLPRTALGSSTPKH